MKDYLGLYFSELLTIVSIINLVLLAYLVFYLKKHKKLHIPHKEQLTSFNPDKKEEENRKEEMREKEEEMGEKKEIETEADNNSLPNKKKENYIELLRPRIAKWVESKAYTH